jgi:serine/threonine protein kinase
MRDRLIGSNLNQYRIIRSVSEDKVGITFRAQDVNLQREVALLVVHPPLASRPNFEDHFVESTRSAARLDHPGVARIDDFGRANEYYYIVIEFIQGKNLQQLLNDLKNEGRWVVLGEAVQLVRQLAGAVDYLRNQGVFQPAVDPAKIGFKPGQVDDLPYRPVMIDPGIVRFLERRLFPEGETGRGPLSYLSPEQTVQRGTDARSDAYSLGILLFELSTGQLPFPIQSFDDAVRYHTRQPTPSPRSFLPDLPESVESIILRATEKNPANRYQDAASLARDLQVALPAANAIVSPPPAFEGSSSLLTPYLQSLEEPARPAIREEYGETKVQLRTAPEDSTPLQIVVEDNQISVEPGGRVTTRAFIVNRSLPSGYFRFSLEGLPDSWFTIAPQVVQLNQGEQKEVNLTIEPPRVPESRAGRYPLTFQVSSEPRPGQSAEVSITLSVAAFSRFSSQVEPKLLTAGEIAQVSIENQGNTPDTFKINFTDREGSLVFTPPEAQMRLVEGQSGTAEFKTGLRQARWIGGEMRHAFSTNVSAAAGETQSHSGEFASLPVIPFWVLGLLLFSCLCSAGLLAFFFSRAGLEETRATATFLAEQTSTFQAIESTSGAMTATALFLANANQATIEAVTATAAWLDRDDDGDGLSNRRELELGTNPQDPDTDKDGISDGDDPVPLQTSTPTPDLNATAQAATQTAAAQQGAEQLTSTAQSALAATAQSALTGTAQAAIEATAGAIALTQTAQAAAETAIALTATAQAPTAPPPPPEETRLVFFHLADTSTANAFRSLLQDNGYIVDLMPLDAAPTVDFDPYGLILLGPDTGNEGAWGDAQGDQANVLNQTLLPILGIEEGGASFFGLFDLPLGWENGITGEGTNVTVVDPANPVWAIPHDIDIPDDLILPLYTANSDLVAISGEAPPAELSLIAQHPENPAYYLIARFQDRFLLWGYESDPEEMTPAGQQLFINLVELLLP